METLEQLKEKYKNSANSYIKQIYRKKMNEYKEKFGRKLKVKCDCK